MDETAILLCAGPIHYTNLPIGTNTSNAMIPINGKPVIGWILDDLLSKEIRRAAIVYREQDTQIREFIQRAYATRIDLLFIPLSKDGTIVESLSAGLEASQPKGTVHVILGDTLITDSFKNNLDYVYIGSVNDSRRWCLATIDSNQRIIDFIDKQELAPRPYQALAGYYHFQDSKLLRESVHASLANCEDELSCVLRRYGTCRPIYTIPVTNWYDFGNIDNLVDARRRLLKPRYFNSLAINPVLNTITKISEQEDKLQDELDWYLNIPDDLKVLSPRILSIKKLDGHLQIVQEYYGYPTLAELFIYGELHADTWFSILKHILRIHQEFRRYPGHLIEENIRAMYLSKTKCRLNELVNYEPAWNEYLRGPTLQFNGRSLKAFYMLESDLELFIESIVPSAPISIIHGDFCFSNILFDVANQIVRLIDPRGRFDVKGIYGDARYDIAKLRHSVSELYDFIVADMFELKETPGGFIGTFFLNDKYRVIANEFDRMLEGAGYDLKEIACIEGLLFISMLPIHKGQPQRQKMMYLTGLSLLNEVLQ